MTCLGLAFRFMEEYWIEQILIIIKTLETLIKANKLVTHTNL